MGLSWENNKNIHGSTTGPQWALHASTEVSCESHRSPMNIPWEAHKKPLRGYHGALKSHESTVEITWEFRGSPVGVLKSHGSTVEVRLEYQRSSLAPPRDSRVSRDYHGDSMGCPREFQGVIMLPWDSHEISMGFSDFRNASLGLSWEFHGTSMGLSTFNSLSWIFHGTPIGPHGIASGVSWDFHGTSMGRKNNSHRTVVPPWAFIDNV